jgi:hypothetical protein
VNLGGTLQRRLALGVVVLGAFALRVFPFFGPDGTWGARLDYDEGVYFSAASYVIQGVWPWRDFGFVHPPGLMLFLALSSAWTASFLGVAKAFSVARWVAALVGALNTLLVARLLSRWTGSAALLGALMYATYPELVQVERGPFLEPLLNGVCLAMTLAVVRGAEQPRWMFVAGALGGVALSIKLWAVVWLLGAAWAAFSAGGLRRFVVGAVLAFVAIVGPFFVLEPATFVEQVVLFHLWRPPDGTIERLPRLGQIVSVRHLASPMLAVFGAGLLVWKRQWAALPRVAVVAWALTLVAFFASKAYWNQYNAHLIASEALVAAGVFSLVPPRARLVLALGTIVSLCVSISYAIRRSLPPPPDHLAIARGELGTTDACVFTFEPGWSLAADRLPPRQTGPLVDNYAMLLLDAVRGGKRFPSSAVAFASGPPPPAKLLACEWIVTGERGARQLSHERLEQTHQQTAPGIWYHR